MSLSLDDFEWVEEGFDRWRLIHKRQGYTIAIITNFNGWHVRVYLDQSNAEPLHVDALDAAKAIAQITAQQHMEKYHAKFDRMPPRYRVKEDGPPSFREGIFKVG